MSVPALSQLYPPPIERSLRDVIDSILTGDRDAMGKMILRREISVQEREALTARGKVLAQWTERGSKTRKAAAISEMLMGFGGRDAGEEQAQIIVAQYVHAAKDIPLWAVERACQRLATGSVTPEEVGEKTLSRTYRPTTAHVCILARSYTDPLQKELRTIGNALRGIVERPASTLSLEEREEFITRSLADFTARTGMGSLDEAGRDERHKRESEARCKEARERIAGEYQKAGLPVPKGDPPTSLPMMLKMGCRIETVNGRRVLVSPTKRHMLDERE